jgi:hypothetical protein
VLFAIWGNTHGSWLIGMVLLCVFIASGAVRVDAGSIENAAWTPAQLKKLLVATGVSFAALFLNPYGWRLVTYPFNLAFHQQINIAHVIEWRPLDFNTVRGRVFLFCLAMVFLLQLVRRRKWALYEIAFLFIGFFSAMSYSRFLFLAAIISMPLLAKDIPGLGPSPAARNRPWLNVALLVALGLVVFYFPSPAAERRDQAEARFPMDAIPFLADFYPRGNVFNEYIWGGFLEWHARQIPVMIDPRSDIFEYNGTLKDYLDAIELRNTTEVLKKYNIRYVLFERNSPLVRFLMQTSAWKVDYADDETILLERTAPL